MVGQERQQAVKAKLDKLLHVTVCLFTMNLESAQVFC